MNCIFIYSFLELLRYSKKHIFLKSNMFNLSYWFKHKEVSPFLRFFYLFLPDKCSYIIFRTIITIILNLIIFRTIITNILNLIIFRTIITIIPNLIISWRFIKTVLFLTLIIRVHYTSAHLTYFNIITIIIIIITLTLSNVIVVFNKLPLTRVNFCFIF